MSLNTVRKPSFSKTNACRFGEEAALPRTEPDVFLSTASTVL